MADDIFIFLENVCILIPTEKFALNCTIDNNPALSHPDSKFHGTNMGPTWVLSASDGPHDGPMNLAIWAGNGLALNRQ